MKKRKAELERLVSSMPVVHPVTLVSCGYEGETFEETAKGLEGEPEGEEPLPPMLPSAAGGRRRRHNTSCPATFYDNFIYQPLKKCSGSQSNRRGNRALYGIAHLPADFKKKDGYKRSIELSGNTDSTAKLLRLYLFPTGIRTGKAGKDEINGCYTQWRKVPGRRCSCAYLSG